MQSSTIIKPKQQEFDIINPTAGPQGEGKLRMSRHGMFVVDQRNNKPDMNVAGVKKVAKKGEENIRVIWPNEKAPAYNERNRSLDSSGID